MILYMKPSLDSKAAPVDHMANERTFLAWVRTSIGIMVFGFVVEKFGLFLKQLSLVMGKAESSTTLHISTTPSLYSSMFGVALVLLGSLLCILAYIKFKKTEKQLIQGQYQPLALLDLMLTLCMILIGVSLAIYLIHQF
jgi:putative membrane protein